MHIISNEGLEFELKIENLEDLWVLSEFILPEDRIFATTQRKVKIGNDKTKQVTKIIFVDLKVTKTSFETQTLRITGEIQNETEFTAQGQTHTLNFTPNDSIKIKKNQLLSYEKKLLEKAINSKSSKNLLVLLDKDELIVSEFSEFSFKVLLNQTGLGSKKYHLTQVNEQEEKYQLIEEILKTDYSTIIFAGPSNYKDKLQKYVKDKIGLNSLTFFWHDVNTFSVQKVIKEISLSGLLEETQFSKESELVSHLLKNISLDKKNAYGLNQVSNSVNVGSCEKLLISTKYIDKQKEENNYTNLNELIKTAEQLQADLTIINSKNEPGKILDGLGGIAAILRY